MQENNQFANTGSDEAITEPKEATSALIIDQSANQSSKFQTMKHPANRYKSHGVTQGVKPYSRGAQFQELKQLVSLESSILTDAHSSLNASLIREKHERMSNDYEEL